MVTVFPTGLDDFNNPTGQNHMNDAGVIHSKQHANNNDALEAMERKIGVDNSNVTTSHDYKIRSLQDDFDTITISSVPYGSLTAWEDYLTLGDFLDGRIASSGQIWHVLTDADPSDLKVTGTADLELVAAGNAYMWIEDIGPIGQMSVEFEFGIGSTSNAKVIAQTSNQEDPADASLTGLRFEFSPTGWAAYVWDDPSFPAAFQSGSYSLSTGVSSRVNIRRISVEEIGITLPDGSMVTLTEPTFGDFDTYWTGTVLVGIEQPSGSFATDHKPIIHTFTAGGVWNTLAGATGPGVPDGGTTGQFLVKLSNANQDSGWTSPSDISVASDGLWTAAGQTVYSTGSGTATKLDIGSAGQIYVVNGGATAPTWVSAISKSAITNFDEEVQDLTGAMVTGNTETGITVTYDDPTGKLNFVVTDSPTVATFTPAQLRDRSTHTGTQLAATISNFSEAVDDRVASLLVEGVGIDLVYDDATNSITITGYAGAAADPIFDAAGDLLVGTGNNTGTRLARGVANDHLTVNSAGTALEWADFGEDVADTVGAMVSSNTESGITVSYQDADNTLDFTVTDAPLLNGQNAAFYQNRTNHTGSQLAATISDFATEAKLLISVTDSSRIDLGYNNSTGVITADLITDSIDNTFLANMAQSTIKGRAASAGTGDPTDLTPTQVKTLLAIANTDVSGLGTMSTQSASSVSITGGSITGITDLVVADGGTGLSTVAVNSYLKGNGTSPLVPRTYAEVLSDIGAATATHTHASVSYYQTQTYAILGDGTSSSVFVPHAVSKQAAETLTLEKTTYRVNSGTPSIKITKNGVDLTGYSGASIMAVTTTKASTTSSQTLADGDEISLVCTTGSWTGWLYLTLTYLRSRTVGPN